MPLLAAPRSLLTLLPTRLVTRLVTRVLTRLATWLLSFLLAWLLPVVPTALAGPVDWHEVPASSEGRQWWDAGSLRLSRGGNLSVLSRFQPAGPEAEVATRPRSSELYVMEIDCNQHLFRDTSVNGLPKLRAEWQPAGGDQLIDAVIEEACAAGQDLLA